jgi:hypothetical protein
MVLPSDFGVGDATEQQADISDVSNTRSLAQ